MEDLALDRTALDDPSAIVITSSDEEHEYLDSFHPDAIGSESFELGDLSDSLLIKIDQCLGKEDMDLLLKLRKQAVNEQHDLAVQRID